MEHTSFSRLFLVCFIVFMTIGHSFTQFTGLKYLRVYSQKTHKIDHSITGIYQDNLGFIWITGTENMYRFDGLHFASVLTLKDKNFDFPAIEAGRNDIVQDHVGRYWFLTASALVRWDPRLPSGQAWTKYGPDICDSIPFPKNKMHRITLDGKGYIWLVFDEENLYKIDPETGKAIQRIEFRITEAGLLRSEIDAMVYHVDDNRIYFGADHLRIIGVNPDNGQIEYPYLALHELLKKSGVYNKFKNHFISDFVKDSTDWWLSFLDNSTLRYSFKKNTFKVIHPISKNNSFQFSRVKKGPDGMVLTLDPQYGLATINPKNNSIAPGLDKEDSYNDKPGIIRDIFFDRQGTLWLGAGNGLYKYDQNEQMFSDYYSFDKQKEVIPQTFFEDNQEVEFLGTNMGLYYRDKSEKKFHCIKNSKHIGIVNIVRWSTDCLLLGTTNGLYSCCGKKMKNVVKLNVSGDEVSLKYYYENPAHSIVPDTIDSQPIIWLGSKFRFFYKYDVKSKKVSVIFPEENNPLYYHHQNILNIIKTDKKDIWITTWGGGIAKMIDKKNVWFDSYQNIPGALNSLQNNNICDASIANNGNIWLATSTGIDIFNYKNFTHIPSQFGKSRFVSAVCKGDNNDMWTISGNEVVQWNSDGKLLRSFTKERNIFNSLLYKKNGQIIFWDNKTNQFNDFTSNKIYVFDSKKSVNNAIPPKTTIIGLKIMLDDSSHILLGNNPVFAHDKNNFTFDFASSALTSSELNKFSWKLVGYDDEWSAPVTGRYSVSYQNLKPGAYTFLVKSCNVAGLWDISGTSFNFNILPPWYETLIFRVLAFLSVLAFLWYLFTLQINKQVALQILENERAMAVSNERNRIARDMHDDLGSGLSAIHLYSEYLKNMIESDFPQLSSQLNHIVNSSGELNQKLKEIIWSNESNEISLITLTSFVKSFVQSGTGDIQFSIIGPEANADTILDHKVHKNLLLSIKELINNALKYSGASEIKVEIHCIARSKSIIILIVDNGKGFDFNTAILKGGNGLKNIVSRMNEIGGTMQVDSGSFGTKTKLLLP